MWAMLAQQGADNPTGVVEGLIGGAGVAGIWLLTILAGKMHPASSMDRERARADKAEARVETLTDVYTREILPALNNAAAAVASSHGKTA